jgi:hypothetical protein
MKRYFLFLFILFSISFSFEVYALGSSDISGFTPGQIWYSKEPLVEGETVNIHTSLWNGEENSLSVKVEFYDKNVILGSRDVIVKASELKDVSVPWKITAGDHIISAKIISSLQVISSNNKEEISLTRSSTLDYKQSISATVKNTKGETVSVSDTVKTELGKVGEGINEIIPASISESVSNNIVSIENLRNDTSTKINNAKNESQKELDYIKNTSTTSKIVAPNNSIEDNIQKPLAYIKLFLLSVLAFVFNNKIIFYGIIIFVVFSIIRLIYRKIRNR